MNRDPKNVLKFGLSHSLIEQRDTGTSTAWVLPIAPLPFYPRTFPFLSRRHPILQLECSASFCVLVIVYWIGNTKVGWVGSVWRKVHPTVPFWTHCDASRGQICNQEIPFFWCRRRACLFWSTANPHWYPSLVCASNSMDRRRDVFTGIHVMLGCNAWCIRQHPSFHINGHRRTPDIAFK